MPQMEDVDWTGIPYDNTKLQEIAADCLDILHRKGRVTNYDLYENNDLSDYGLSESTIKYDVLPKIRERLSEEGIIEVNLEEMDQGTVAKVWVEA